MAELPELLDKLNLADEPYDIVDDIDEDSDDDEISSIASDHEEIQEVWDWWWEAEPTKDRALWKTLEHNGPAFPPPYERLPSHVRFLYDRAEFSLSKDAEEVAGFYARRLDHDYTDGKAKQLFNSNFFEDWRLVMSPRERDCIKDFSKCDFSEIHKHFQNISPEKKKLLRNEQQEKYGFCVVNGRREKVSSYRISTGLYRPRGKHTKMGMLKMPVLPGDVTINCSKDKAPKNAWGKIVSKNTVRWLACWKNNLGQKSYMKFHANSAINGKRDYEKFETSRKLHNYIDFIRTTYKNNWDLEKATFDRQLAIALFLIDKLALRVGNQTKETDNVGCCSLLVKHVTLHHNEDNEYHVTINFEGKCSIVHLKKIKVNKLVYRNLKQFKSNKQEDDKLFDKLSAPKLNAHLKKLMPGLTAKVFRTYHASKIYEETLEDTDAKAKHDEKLIAEKKANRAAAVLCNHKQSIRDKTKENQHQEKDFETSMKNSREFYIDPRITVAWCIKHKIDCDKIFTKSQLNKFNWAIAMVNKEQKFKFIIEKKAEN